MSFFGSLVSAAGGLAGGLLGKKSADSAAAANYAMQKEFAQNGIRWKVADAKAAGLHPLAALGAQTMSPTASFQGGDYSFLGDMGQNIGRAIEAKQTKEERLAQEAYNQQSRNLNLENMQLQNDMLRAQISSISQTALPPSMPSRGGIPTVVDGQGDAINPKDEYIYVRDEAGRVVRMLNPDIASAGIEEDPVGTIQRAFRSIWDATEGAVSGGPDGKAINPFTGVKTDGPGFAYRLADKLNRFLRWLSPGSSRFRAVIRDREGR